MEYGLIGAGLLLFFTITFFVAKSQKNNGLIDIVWGLGFVVSALMSYFVGNPTGTVPKVMTLLVTIWGLRLSFYLARRNLGKPEDFRYADMRAKWDPRTFHIRMFVQIYLLQLVLNYLINLTTIVTNLAGTIELGDAGDAWGDRLDRGVYLRSSGRRPASKFQDDSRQPGAADHDGLWRYTRHPNYFGEATPMVGLVPDGRE
jgi:steroid 5-alpha reductase family enzyme